MNDREIFLSALEIEDQEARVAYVGEACAGDSALLERVTALLESHASQSEFLKTPAIEQISSGGQSQDDAAVTVERESYKKLENDGPPLGYLAPSDQEDSLGRLGHYEVLEVIGSGAFGTVLKAFDEKLQRVVAIKVLSPEMAATSPARKRFLREARSSAKVRHENVVNIYAVEDEPIPYLVMEYIPGKTLQERLDEYGPLDPEVVLRVGKQIADGLAAAHAQHLIHRDVKPGNILLDTSIDDQVKITDFGLARTADDATVTQSGVIAGTPLYMAPEQALGHRLDQRADLFSLGSVLYQMVSGRPPFRAPSTVAVLRRVAEDTPRPIREIIPETPKWLCTLISHLHAKNPDDRYGSAKEVSALLADCLHALQSNRTPMVPAPECQADQATTATTTVSKRDQPRSGQRQLLIVCVVGLVVLFMCLGFTEATGMTGLTATVIRLATGSGTLLIEVDDPGVSIAIDGEEIHVRGGGVQELKLRPGDYMIAASKDSQPVKQELITITREGRTTFRISLESLGDQVSQPVAVVTEAETSPAHVATDGRFALVFDGDDDYVATPVRFDGTPSLTLEATVLLKQWPTKDSSEIVSNTHRGGVSLGASEHGFKFAVHNGDEYVHAEIPRDDRYLNRPVKLAAVLAKRAIYLFVDGELIDKEPIRNVHSSGELFSIGTSPGDGKPHDEYDLEWKGQIREVRISNYARYLADYDTTRPLRADTYTLALYRFDEGQGDMLKDASNHEQHGTIVGATWLDVSQP